MGAAAIVVVAALVALAAVVKGDFSDTDGDILVTLAALLYTGGAAICGLTLVDRDRARLLGWIVAGTAPVCLAFIALAIWSFADGGENQIANKLAWSAALELLAGLMATTALLLARRPALVGLAAAAGALATLAATVSAAGI
jgi:hypothetical protein